MKKITLGLVLLFCFSELFAQAYYCPNSLNCTATGCDNVTPPFYIQGYLPFQAGKYMFVEALTSGDLETSACTYMLKDFNNGPIIHLGTALNLVPPSSIEGTKWIMYTYPYPSCIVVPNDHVNGGNAWSCPFVLATGKKN